MKRNIILLGILIITAFALLINIMAAHDKTAVDNNSHNPDAEEPVNAVAINEEVNNISIAEAYKKQWGILNNGENAIPRMDINLPASIASNCEAIAVGIMDTGIDTNHIALKDRIFVNNKEIPDNGIDDDNNGYIDDVYGWDFINNDNTVYDYWGLDKHGTQSAGIVSLAADYSNIKLVPLKVMEGTTNAETDNIIKAIDYAKRMNIKIINCSWTSFKYDKKLEAAIKDSELLFVCAAGNSSSDTAYLPSYPACYELPNIISVAAISNYGELCAFSNYGAGIHITAPGENVITTIPENKYETVSGTSIAAPFVTGAAACISLYCPNIKYTEIADRIKDNAFRTDSLTEFISTGGILDVYEAVANEDKALECPTINNADNVEGGIQLYWSEVAAAVSYEIEINRNIIIEVKDTTYKYQNAEGDRLSTFRVRAKNNKQKSKWSICKIFK